MSVMDIRAAEIFLAVCDTGGASVRPRTYLGHLEAAVPQRLNQLERDLGDAADQPARPDLLAASLGMAVRAT